MNTCKCGQILDCEFDSLNECYGCNWKRYKATHYEQINITLLDSNEAPGTKFWSDAYNFIKTLPSKEVL